jgi:hypothetical protein
MRQQHTIIPLPEKPHRAFKNLIGEKFDRLVVIGYGGSDRKGQSIWVCKCDCGNETYAPAYKLKSGHTKSCGCLSVELLKQRVTTHGRSKSAEFKIWQAMINRCTNKKQISYRIYGGRGIQVCPRWLESFENFYADMGSRPTAKYSIERKDNNGTGYRKNQYDIRLAKRYEHWRKIKDTPYDPKDLKWSSEDAIKETLQNGQQEEIDIVKDVKSSEASVVKAPETIQVPTEIGKPSPSFIAWLVNLFKKAPKT